MACGCRGNCNCIIEDGATTTVTGSGSVIDPYVVEVTQGAVTITIADTECIDLSGDGSLASPLMADIIIAPDDGGGNGVECGPTGLFVAPSTDLGNTLIFGSDGRLLVPSDPAIAAHESDAVDAHDASAVSFVPAGPISSTDVQSATVEIATTLVPNNQIIDYALVLADAGKVVEINAAADKIVTVPLNATAAFPVNTIVLVQQLGAGTVTVAGAGGVTVSGSTLTTNGIGSGLLLRKTATDTWVVQPSASTAGVVTRTATGTTDTLILTDAGKVVRYTNAALVTSTVPPNATVAFAIGTIINIYAGGLSGVTIAAGAGVTIRNNSSPLALYEECSLRKDATDEWVRVG